MGGPHFMSVRPSVKRHRARFSISLRGLMLLVLIIGLWMGWTINRAESRRGAVAALKNNGAIVLYDYESMRGVKTPTARQWAPAWLQRRLGDDYFHNVTYANMTPVAGHQYQLTDRDLAPQAGPGTREQLRRWPGSPGGINQPPRAVHRRTEGHRRRDGSPRTV